ncbi:oxidoreductase alpha (molybdopterin) subunit [Neorhodopirellula lusitana]|uniref:Oxidoreductase alpha (Molybdopterin) subunit n=1 Tax=Neorhodopirellula lusitana TaxID=445327 RepID=A0ABY1PY90_9BACT|nr:FdhF/YdeP family oxidoreductase [Neorhodopirellula lusitana]SMP52934.1 oxidoreductase alpha (molybdopterin) subunit [Neorhodopirellula lusitana]
MSTTVPPSSSDVIAVQADSPSLDNGHGPIELIPTEEDGLLKQKPVKTRGTGLPAVLSSFRYAIGEAGPLRGTLPMLQINQGDGFDCPGCAWPDPDKERSAFEFCENGAKAVAHESDKRRITRSFFERYSVSEMSRHSDYWLEQQGRLTEPMVLRENATHYQPISWDEAFGMVADQLQGLDSPDEACFYTSGKATNEAAFAFQVFARGLGTNNMPDCSNMCHESSGRAMTRMFGHGKGTVLLEDFKKAELVFVVGQNPGTNHPRQLTALQQAKRAGAKVILVNPLPEAGMMGFMNPQEVGGMLGKSTQLTDEFLQVKINGDIPLFKGILKQLVEWDDAQGGIIDRDFVEQHTIDLDDLLADVRAAEWNDIVRRSGIGRDQITTVAKLVRDRERIIICWCLGVTQHRNGTQNVQEFLNLLLLRGAIGKPGAGACCVRGHSNVQGDRTMGVWEQPKKPLLDRMQEVFQFEPPRHHGFDSHSSAIAMHEGKLKVFVSLGGNFLMAMPDTRYAAEALQNTDLTVRIGTKLNRADLATGRQSLILPCLGRTERDVRVDADGKTECLQLSSTENSMGVVQRTTGRFEPASAELMNETEIICRLAHATLGDRMKVDWLGWANDYDQIRDAVAQVIPGFEDYNIRVRQDGGFYLPNGPRERQFPTPTGKAVFTVNPIPPEEVGPGQFAMTTVRSHDQFNTTIYGLHDRYRGIYNARQVVMMNQADMDELGLTAEQSVDVASLFEGKTRQVRGFKVVPYPIPRQCLAMYFPEANPLIPMGSTDEFSNCPSYKHTIVTVSAANGSQGH